MTSAKYYKMKYVFVKSKGNGNIKYGCPSFIVIKKYKMETKQKFIFICGLNDSNVNELKVYIYLYITMSVG